MKIYEMTDPQQSEIVSSVCKNNLPNFCKFQMIKIRYQEMNFPISNHTIQSTTFSFLSHLVMNILKVVRNNSLESSGSNFSRNFFTKLISWKDIRYESHRSFKTATLWYILRSVESHPIPRWHEIPTQNVTSGTTRFILTLYPPFSVMQIIFK